MAEGEQSQTSKGQVGPWILLGPWSWWPLGLGGPLNLGGPWILVGHSILVGGGDPRSETHYLGRVSRLFLLLKLVHGVN